MSYSAHTTGDCFQCSVNDDPNVSIHHRSRQLKLCPLTLWKILRKDLG